MGSAMGGVVDHHIGSIVWVRRRNGSWWPGRILESNELSASHLMSPRSGTPVKLLGREDASVDWYNLEKSKRVKAFRCGEFDDCIIKAESCAGIPAKKREKYARREDAILHALELEKQQLERRNQSTCHEAVQYDEKDYATLVKKSKNFVVDCYNDKSQRTANDGTCSEILESKSHVDSGQSGVSGQRTSTEFGTIELSIQKAREGNEANREDDGSEGTTRMRRLQDFGLRIAQTKKKPNMLTVSEGMGKVVPIENCACNASSIASPLENKSSVNKNKGPSSNLKRKRSHVGHGEEFSIKRRDRRRPLMQVLQSSAKLPVPHLSDFGCSGDDRIWLAVKQEVVDALQPKQVKQSSFCISHDNNSNCTETACQHVSKIKLVDNTCSNLEQPISNTCDKSGPCSVYQVDETSFSDTFQGRSITRSPKELDVRHLGHPIQGHASCVNKHRLDNVNFSDSLSKLDCIDQNTVAVGDARASKWQLKGKRNARHVSKKSFESTSERTLVEADHACSVNVFVNSYKDKLYVKERLETKKASGNPCIEPEASPKFEMQLDYCFVPDCDQTDDSAKSNVTAPTDERQHRTGRSSLPGKQAEVQFLSIQERFEDPTQESESGCISNENSEVLLLPSLEICKQECSPCDGSLHNSGMFPKVMQKAPNSLNQAQFKQSDVLPKLLQSLEWTSIEARLDDVHIDVQGSYQGEHVPLVSLMSKLNGKAIIGHPITVETTEDSYYDMFIAEDGYLDDSIINFQSYDDHKIEGGALQTVWRTARRTVMQRTPRSCRLVENVNPSSSNYSNLENRQPLVSKVYPSLNHKIQYIRKNLSHLRHPTLDPKLSKKFLKKVGLPSQKIKMLSSITVEHSSRNETNELAYPLKTSAIPIVSCIPIKLIFSRIKEAVDSASNSGSQGLSSTRVDAEKPR